jgi:hypothetical protein
MANMANAMATTTIAAIVLILGRFFISGQTVFDLPGFHRLEMKRALVSLLGSPASRIVTEKSSSIGRGPIVL